MHIVVVFINIGSYHAARLAAADVACRKRGWKVTAVQITNDTLEHAWGDISCTLGIPLVTLLERRSGDRSDFQAPFSREASVQLTRCLNNLQPDAVLIPGWSFSVAIAALKWCRRNRRIPVLASESNEFDSPRKWWRELFKSLRVKQFSSALVGGKSHARYLVKLGFNPTRIAYGYDVVDNATFSPDRIRQLSNPHPQPYFLGVSRFIPKKNLMVLLESYASYRELCKSEPWHLVLCGNGELQSEMERFIELHQLSNFVRLPGFLKPDQLLPYFGHAKCLVHASTEEQWGLVVNEALASGLPVLVSTRCGCFEDLVVDGQTGFGFEPTDREKLARLMLLMSSCEVDLEKMGRASLEQSKCFPASRFGDGLVQAVEMGSNFRKCLV